MNKKEPVIEMHVCAGCGTAFERKKKTYTYHVGKSLKFCTQICAGRNNSKRFGALHRA